MYHEHDTQANQYSVQYSITESPGGGEVMRSLSILIVSGLFFLGCLGDSVPMEPITPIESNVPISSSGELNQSSDTVLEVSSESETDDNPEVESSSLVTSESSESRENEQISKAEEYVSSAEEELSSEEVYIPPPVIGPDKAFKIEAEEYTATKNENDSKNQGSYSNGKNDGVDLEKNGSVINVGWFEAGEELHYDFEVAQSGNYTLEFRVATGESSASLLVSEKDGSSVNVSVSNTGGWQKYSIKSVSLWITSPKATLVVKAKTDGVNFDYVTLKYVNDIKPVEPEIDTTEYAEGWDLVWSDEFNGSALDESIWTIDQGGHGWGNEEVQNYTPNNVTVEDGSLVLIARREWYDGNDFTSGKVISQNKKSFKYGRIAARIKMPSGDGMWPAFWLLGDSQPQVGWPQCGEIDVMEAKGRIPSVASGAVHMGVRYDNKDLKWGEVEREMDLDDGFHVYAVEWDANEIRWYNDDINFFSTSAGVSCSDAVWCPFGEARDWNYFILLNLAIGGHFDNYVMPPGSWNSTTMEIDWVRVYEEK